MRIGGWGRQARTGNRGEGDKKDDKKLKCKVFVFFFLSLSLANWFLQFAHCQFTRHWRIGEYSKCGMAAKKDITLVNGYFEMYRSFNGAVSRSKFYKQATNENAIDDIIQYAGYEKMFM